MNAAATLFRCWKVKNCASLWQALARPLPHHEILLARFASEYGPKDVVAVVVAGWSGLTARPDHPTVQRNPIGSNQCSGTGNGLPTTESLSSAREQPVRVIQTVGPSV